MIKYKALLILIVFLSCKSDENTSVNSNISMQEISPTTSGDFKKQQMTFTRVKEAYKEKYQRVGNKLLDSKLEIDNFELYIRAFKEEKELEIWARKPNEKFILVETFSICKSSGDIGPKRQQGDEQVPEGFYHFDRFNPKSLYHLSLGINYPNTSDRILGTKGKLGGDIFIHGKCMTIGCLPMTDEFIKSIYVYAVEAKNNGQETIPVSFFPNKMTDDNYRKLKENGKNLTLYSALKKGYDIFEESKRLPTIGFNSDGSMNVTK